MEDSYMDYEKLERLMGVSKKSDANRSKQREYLTQMEMILEEEGLSYKARHYLWNGFSFCGAQPLGDYLRTFAKEERLGVVQDFIKSSNSHEIENIIVFKMCTGLLGYFINYMPDNTDVIGLLIKHFLAKYKKKDGSFSKQNLTIIEKYFIAPYIWGSDFPVWDTLGLNSRISLEFCAYMLNALSNVNRKYEQKASTIASWLETGLPQNNGNSNTGNTSVNVSREAQQDSATETKEINKNPQNDNSGDSDTNVNSDVQTIFKVAKNLDVCAQQIRIFATKYKKLIATNEALETQYKEQQKKTKEATKELDETRSEAEKLNLAIKQAEAENKELQEEITRLQSVISVYSVDKQSSMDSQLNAIASKLKHEYSEFKDAMDMEMTVEIGEILRDQLNRVFKALIKAGIDVEKR